MPFEDSIVRRHAWRALPATTDQECPEDVGAEAQKHCFHGFARSTLLWRSLNIPGELQRCSRFVCNLCLGIPARNAYL